jgi:cytochrome c oxidase subunit II
VRRAGLAALLALVAAGCGEAPAGRDTPSSLDPQGRGARLVADEMWVQFAVAAVAFAVVVALLSIAIRRSRAAREERLDVDAGGTGWVLAAGVAFPAVVLTFLFTLVARDMDTLVHEPSRPTVLVEITAHRWWWEVTYPEAGVSTANQLAVPVGATVRLRLTSGDVIHSFWVPQLQRKVDAIPGESTLEWLQVDRAGVYRGVCAEFCGLQHARMHFLVEAMPADRFEQWLTDAKKPARPPKTPSEREGLGVFTTGTCAYCHTIAGTPAGGDFGPDLTHVASRPAIAGALLPVTRGNLGGWIMDPQHVKPGANMPPGDLTGRELQALLDYLESLR